VSGWEIVDPLDLEGMARAGFDDGGEGGWAVAPHAGGWDVAMDLGVDLAYGDAEFAGVGYSHCFWQREGVDEGRKLKDVQHWDRLAGGGGDGCVGCLVHVAHLGEALCEAMAGAMEEAKGGGLLQEASAGRAGIGQRVGSGIVWLAKKHALRWGVRAFKDTK
jgi:hypothetical protein